MQLSIKVAWICHFSNKEVQDILKPSRRINEMAPWIPALAEKFEEQKNIELHIISPHEYIINYKYFIIRGIHYHFFNPHIPLWGRHWPGFFKFDFITNFFINKLIVKRIINRIRPDIINLHGAENAYYSSTIFQFKNKFPILITIQGFLFKISADNNDFQTRKRINCEIDIYKNFIHFGIRTITMGNEIKQLNFDASLHWHSYVVKISTPLEQINTSKRYDVVYFARISKSKGIEDLLHSISMIKKTRNDISVLIIGSASSNYLSDLKKLSHKLGIENNLHWAGFLPSQEEVHKAASEARISVLPAYYDIISGTIIESMLLKIPVIAYNVGSIHEVNAKEEILFLIEKNNIQGIADTILQLLNDDKLCKNRSEKGYYRALEILNDDKVISDLLKCYDDVICAFKNSQLD